MHDRRRFLLRCGAFAATALILRPRLAFGSVSPRRKPHPDPRPGITADKVLTAEQLAGFAVAIPAFDEVRQIPQIADGIRCSCGCADQPGFYSLLSCYEGKDAMARYCEICQGEGRLAYRLFQAGKSLDEIRAAMDARFG